MATSRRQGSRQGARPGARQDGRPSSGASRPQRRAPHDAGGPRPADVISALVAGPLADAGLDLEGVVVRRSGDQHVVQVAVDRDGGVDLDAIADASRLLSGLLDAHDDELPSALRGTYVLEVSSRGTSEPLALPRHWRRAVTRLVEVRRAGQQPVVGRIVGADDDGADLDVDGAVVRVMYADVTKALVQLEFSRPAGSPDALAEEDLDDAADLDDLDDPEDPEDDADAEDEEETP